MRFCSRRRAPALAAGLAVLAAALPAVASSQARPSADALRDRAADLERRSRAALLDLYALETRVARARGEVRLADARLAALRREADSARRRVVAVRRSLAASRARVSEALRALYLDGETDAIALVLGSRSLDEVLTGLDGLDASVRHNSRLAAEARAKARRLGVLQATLDRRRGALEDARSRAAAGAASLERAAGERRATLSALRSEGSLTRARLASLQEQARAAQRRSARIEAHAAATTPQAPAAPSRPPPPAPAPAPAAGTRTLTVDAVAYHLPGRTASGLPVGPGIIAVDPRVIPLGTRVFVPGYGPAVAADTGTAIKGNIIDLWMPSTPHARAWGRRTVTITVYG